VRYIYNTVGYYIGLLGASILKIWWQLFPTSFNAAKCYC